MLRQKLLRLGHPVSLQGLIEAMAADATQRGGDYRPHIDSLTCLVADGRKLPPWVDISAGEFGLILSDEPCPELPIGTLLLWIQLRPVPHRGRCKDGLYSGQVVAHLWQGPEYPLSPREVNWFVANYCGAHYDRWRSLTRGWETLSDTSTPRSPDDAEMFGPPLIVLGKTPAPPLDAAPAGPESDPPPPAVPPTVARRRKARPGLGTGQARTPWNKRLMAMMNTVPTEELYNFDPFFEGWLADYILGVGRAPRYPEDTFKHAATSCAERIIRKRAAKGA